MQKIRKNWGTNGDWSKTGDTHKKHNIPANGNPIDTEKNSFYDLVNDETVDNAVNQCVDDIINFRDSYKG